MNKLPSSLEITRYPATSNRSLQAWNAADEYLLQTLGEQDLTGKSLAIYEDLFGYLSAHLHTLTPLTVVTYKSQQKALEKNFGQNSLNLEPNRLVSPLRPLPTTIDLGIIKIPKSLDLFRLYLDHVASHLSDDGQVLCPFMTRYFSPQMLTIAEEFFEVVEQSLAHKKSRLLILKNKKAPTQRKLLNTIAFTYPDGASQEFKQYFGVFSSGNIDYATQFLIEHLELTAQDRTILDLASGNGVIARAIQRKKPDTEIHLVDDSILAIESSKLNLDPQHTHFHWHDALNHFPPASFDLVVSNPPFHFGHETNIEITLRLFRDVAKHLKHGGRFICVANKHLNYRTHLKRIFSTVETLAANQKFIIYASTK